MFAFVSSKVPHVAAFSVHDGQQTSMPFFRTIKNLFPKSTPLNSRLVCKSKQAAHVMHLFTYQSRGQFLTDYTAVKDSVKLQLKVVRTVQQRVCMNLSGYVFVLL